MGYPTGSIRWKKKTYRPVVMRIVDHWPDGRIKTLTAFHQDQTISLENEEDRHFLIALVNVDMLERGN